MKRLNKAGFTLIELLAVITIMGILMMVAIPSVSRTIENSRRDTFADNALTYVNTVRNAVLADELKCGPTGTTVSATESNKTYYFAINTAEGASNPKYQQTVDLMEKVALSSWGSANISGYVKWVKTENATTKRTTTEYYVCLRDTGAHGFGAETKEKSVTRSSIVTSSANACALPTATGIECTLK